MTTILVVDDEPSVREVLHALLEEEGFDVIEAANGLEAIRRFAENEVDLILSDVVMPKMNGLDLLRNLEPVLQDRIPFVLLTSYEDRDAAEAAIYAGAFDYLTKPTDRRRLRGVIHRALVSVGAIDTCDRNDQEVPDVR